MQDGGGNHFGWWRVKGMSVVTGERPRGLLKCQNRVLRKRQERRREGACVGFGYHCRHLELKFLGLLPAEALVGAKVTVLGRLESACVSPELIAACHALLQLSSQAIHYTV
jgi:hypothetical protein